MKTNSLTLTSTFLFVLALWALTAPFSASAQTTINNEFAQTFYSNCLAQNGRGMTNDTKDIFCSCAAYQMQQSLNIEDIQQLNSPDAKLQRMASNKIILDVYAPCMEFPVRGLIFNNCKKQNAPQAACECLANKMGKYTAGSAQQLLYDVLERNPHITDPMGPIVNSPAFQKKQQEIAMECAKSGLN